MKKKLFMFILSIKQYYFLIDNFILYLLIKKIQKKFKFRGFIDKKTDKKERYNRKQYENWYNVSIL